MAIGESTLFLVQPGEDISDLKRIHLKNILNVKRSVNNQELFQDADLDILTKKLPGAKDGKSQAQTSNIAIDANRASQTITVEYVSDKKKKKDKK